MQRHLGLAAQTDIEVTDHEVDSEEGGETDEGGGDEGVAAEVGTLTLLHTGVPSPLRG